jgi:hypothetical protein
VYVVHATKKLLDRLREQPAAPVRQSTNALGAWYATALFWRPQLALFVNEATLIPVFVPLAPATTVLDRFPNALRVTLEAHAVERGFVDHEIAGMTEHQVAKTANRSVVGIMNEFTFLASYGPPPSKDADLIELSLSMAQTPCGPLYGRHVNPDRELQAFVAEHLGRPPA